jgi:CelD/BcsL family acetyltransferase involved in cellulose biosynthesis
VTITSTAAVLPEVAAPVTVQCLEDSFGFTSLRPRWNELLRASTSDTPFLTWEWLHTWWVHLRESSALRLIVVRAGDELIAIAPLRLVTSPLSFLSRLEFLGTGNAGSDYLDLIVRRGREAESLQAIARFLTARGLAVRFNHLPPTSLAARLAAQLAGACWTTATADDGTCPIIPLAGQTFDSYLATLGSSHRANVRRRIKAIGQQFEMRFDLVTTDAERRQMLAALAVFHAKRYSDRGGSSAFSAPNVRAFQEEITRRALDRGWLRMYALRLNGEIAAVMYGFSYGGTFSFYQHGFDDRYKAQSIGLVLMGLSVRAAIDEGAREFDMLWGTEPYKFLWARDARILQRVELFPLHLGGTLHRHAVEARRRVGRLARRVLSIGESLGS